MARRLAAGALVAGLLVVVVTSDRVHGAFLGLVETAQPLILTHPVQGVLLFVVLAALSATLAFFSSVVLVPVGVEAWGVLATTALLWLGWTLGGASAYAAARFLGRPLAHRVVARSRLERFEHGVSAKTPFGLVLLFQLAVPSEVPGYVLGLARYPFGRYLLVVGLGELPYAIGTVLVGVSLIERRLMLLLGLAAGGALLAAAVVLVWRRHAASVYGERPGSAS
jgi:uncharacterized membrane protein YdjX (TVP38/TMEM64 family)